MLMASDSPYTLTSHEGYWYLVFGVVVTAGCLTIGPLNAILIRCHFNRTSSYHLSKLLLVAMAAADLVTCLPLGLMEGMWYLDVLCKGGIPALPYSRNTFKYTTDLFLHFISSLSLLFVSLTILGFLQENLLPTRQRRRQRLGNRVYLAAGLTITSVYLVITASSLVVLSHDGPASASPPPSPHFSILQYGAHLRTGLAVMGAVSSAGGVVHQVLLHHHHRLTIPPRLTYSRARSMFMLHLLNLPYLLLQLLSFIPQHPRGETWFGAFSQGFHVLGPILTAVIHPVVVMVWRSDYRGRPDGDGSGDDHRRVTYAVTEDLSISMRDLSRVSGLG